MPGTIYHAVPKTTLPLYQLPPPGFGTFILTRSIDVSAYRELTALIRIHSFYAGTSGTTFEVDILAEALSPGDMINDFASTQIAATTTINLGIGIPQQQMIAITPVSAPIGSAVRVRVTTGSAGTINAYVTFSVDIVAKC